MLALNAGSSSIKFALYDLDDPMTRRRRGKIERIGRPGTKLTIDDATGAHAHSRAIDASDPARVASVLFDWLEEASEFSELTAVGHRLVHGGSSYSAPARIDDALLSALRAMSVYSPEHLPMQIDLVERFRQRFPAVCQVACFDTDFHHDMPRVAKLPPIPRRFDAKGIRRFGFHGLSFA